MALVTKSLLYENGELAGIIVVASDAAIVSGIEVDSQKSYQNSDNSQRRERGLNFKKIKWHPRPPIAPTPELASSVSSLVLLHSSFSSLHFRSGIVFHAFFLP